VLNIHDIMFAHDVPAYTATRKWRVLKVLFFATRRSCSSESAEQLKGEVFRPLLACKERKCGGTSAITDENGQVDVWH